MCQLGVGKTFLTISTGSQGSEITLGGREKLLSRMCKKVCKEGSREPSLPSRNNLLIDPFISLVLLKHLLCG